MARVRVRQYCDSLDKPAGEQTTNGMYISTEFRLLQFAPQPTRHPIPRNTSE
jgi:hypothetical protein